MLAASRTESHRGIERPVMPRCSPEGPVRQCGHAWLMRRTVRGPSWVLNALVVSSAAAVAVVSVAFITARYDATIGPVPSRSPWP